MAADLTLHVATFPSPLGRFTVVTSPDGVVATTTGDPQELAGSMGVGLRARPMPSVGRELASYFAGRLRRFRAPVDLSLAGTPFSRDVLRAVMEVPYGELRTYGDVASAAGRPGAARAAGSALARCPIELFVPCHRIVPSGPGLGRYGDAEDRRAFLLRLEGAI